MRHAIQQLRNAVTSHNNQLREWENFFNSQKFSDNTVEGSVNFAIEQSQIIYRGAVKELNEAISILERIDGMRRARKKRGYKC